MAKSRKEIEEEILLQEKIGEEEDYLEFVKTQRGNSVRRSKKGTEPDEPDDYNEYSKRREEELKRKGSQPETPYDPDDYNEYLKRREEAERISKRRDREEQKRQDREYQKLVKEKKEEKND